MAPATKWRRAAPTRKAQASRRSRPSRSRAKSQPRARKSAKPGTGGGAFFHVEVRPKTGLKTLRTHDIGDPGGIERVAGRGASGSWSTVTWLISKALAHREGDRLVADTTDARNLLRTLGAQPRHVRGDRFTAKDRRNVPERSKPAPAPKRAERRNIKKAQAARRRG
ncbi:MAG: hypothetical protein K2X43_19585 [Hyphomonadaceae bacterium]|jgi:hypothetical protein|nr:hypothetical protein [Hyphomonadaceae bacterium]